MGILFLMFWTIVLALLAVFVGLPILITLGVLLYKALGVALLVLLNPLAGKESDEPEEESFSENAGQVDEQEGEEGQAGLLIMIVCAIIAFVVATIILGL